MPLPAALFVSIVQATREDLVKDIKLTLISTVGIMACFMTVYFVFRMFKKNTGADAAVSALISGSPYNRIPRIRRAGAYLRHIAPGSARWWQS